MVSAAERAANAVNIESLRECVELARTLSFTRTAQKFYITQPVLSKHVANVEKELGIDIFLRGKNGVHLTSVGRVFIERCREMLTQYDETLDEIEELKLGRDKPIELGYLYGASATILPKALRAFQKKHPSSEVRYLSMEIDEIPQALDENRIDIAITSDLEKLDGDRFAWKSLYRDTLCLIAPKGHRLANRDSVSVEDLVGEDIIVPRTSFMPNEASHIQKALSPIWETVKQRKLIGDLNSIHMSLLIEGCAAIEFQHLKNLFSSEEFAFIPLNAPIPDFSVIVAWKRSSETTALLDLATELEAQCDKLRKRLGS